MNFSIKQTKPSDVKYAEAICQILEQSAEERGTGIAKRTVEYVSAKITNGDAIIALDGDSVVGFSYIESWSHGRFVANSGLVVKKEYRGYKLGKKIKEHIFKLSTKKYPDASIFGITTSLAVMKINNALGYKPVTFSELTNDESFWKGCSSCQNYDVLLRNKKKMCLCTGMLYEPKKNVLQKATSKLKTVLTIKKK